MRVVHRFAANAVRLQLHALAYNFANFLRTQALAGNCITRPSSPQNRWVAAGALLVGGTTHFALRSPN